MYMYAIGYVYIYMYRRYPQKNISVCRSKFVNKHQATPKALEKSPNLWDIRRCNDRIVYLQHPYALEWLTWNLHITHLERKMIGTKPPGNYVPAVHLQGYWCKFRKKNGSFSTFPPITWHSFGYPKTTTKPQFSLRYKVLKLISSHPWDFSHHRSRLILTNGGFRPFFTQKIPKSGGKSPPLGPRFLSLKKFQVFCFQEYPASCHRLWVGCRFPPFLRLGLRYGDTPCVASMNPNKLSAKTPRPLAVPIASPHIFFRQKTDGFFRC